MGLEEKLKVQELIKKGSKSITTENEDGEHTFITDNDPNLDGETYKYVEKPTYNNEELKRALDADVDELFIAPVDDLPDVIPLSTYERLESDFATASLEIISSSIEIDDLETQVSQLTAESASLAILYSQSRSEYNELLVNFTSQSVELTEKTQQVVELHAYTASVKTQVSQFESEFRTTLSDVSGSTGQVRENSIIIASLQERVSTTISKIQQDSILTISQNLQGEIEGLRGDIGETQAETQRAERTANTALGRLRGVGDVLQQLARRVFSRR